jgi:protein kinase X
MQLDRTKRIGCLKNGAEDINKHKWFRGLNWAALYNKQMPPPLGPPQLAGEDDHSAFANYPDSVEESGPILEPDKQALFDVWSQ